MKKHFALFLGICLVLFVTIIRLEDNTVQVYGN